MNTEEFIKKAKKIHGNKYNYSKSEYKGSKELICIICPEHGEFWQTPNNHLNGKGCKKCAAKSRWEKRHKTTTEEFIEKAKKVHGEKYNYSNVKYVNSQSKVCIICPEHGEFWQTPNAHLNGQGCPNCDKSCKLTKKTFIEKAKKVHGEKYNYSNVKYVNSQSKVCIICPEHGEFWQTPNNHLNGKGCPKCSRLHKLTTKEFIERAKNIHGNKYDYSKAEYKGIHEKICIICPEHGEFWQIPSNHLKGYGCKECNKYYLEKEISNLLINNSIHFEYNKTFEWLKYKNNMYLDFYLPEYNIAIECQGEQHLIKERKFNETKISDENNLERDVVKNDLCIKNGVKLVYFSYTNLNRITENKCLYTKDTYFSNKNNLIEFIRNT